MRGNPRLPKERQSLETSTPQQEEESVSDGLERRIKAIKDMKKFVDDCEEDREKRVLMELPKFSKSKNKTKSKSQYLTNLKVVNAAIEAVLWFRR